MDFLKSVTKDLEKSGIQVGSSEPPRYWFSTGNYVLNRIISGDFLKGIPQGRITAFTGPSGTGKSFLLGNAVREAQNEGAFIVVLDSENALDDNFMIGIGVDVTKNYYYVAVDTISQTKQVVSQVIKGFKKDHGNGSDAPKLMIVIDSLDMLMTETEEENFDKGISKGDMGQRSKQLKAMLREFVQAVKRPNINMIVTAQVYKNQDKLNGEGVWIVADAIKFSLSQVVLLTKLKMRDKSTRIVHGIFMKVEGYKTRFAKPFQTATLEVPYETGMDPYSGLLEVAVELGLVEKHGSRYAITSDEKTWYSKDFGKYAPEILREAEKLTNTFLDANIDENNDDVIAEIVKKQTPNKTKREQKHITKNASDKTQ
jgi:recombination protein RecA